MARQLDFSPLDQRQQILQSGAYRAKLKSQHPIFEAALQAGGNIMEAQKGLRTELNALSEYDEDITLDAQVNSWLSDDFKKNVKDTYVTNLLGKEKKVGQKWLLTNSDLNKVQAKAKQWERTAGNAKALVNARANSFEEVRKNPLIYEIDNEERKRFDNVITGKEDVPNPNAIFQDIMQNPDGAPPFLRIREHDLEQGIGEHVTRNISKVSQYMLEPGTQIAVDKNGVRETVTIKEKQLSPAGQEALKGLVWTDLNKDPRIAGYGKWLSKQDGALEGYAGVADYFDKYDFDQHFDFGEEKVTKRVPISEKVKGKGLRLNFSGGDDLDYDSNRTDFTIEGREYKDVFTFPEYATKERVDVIKDASEISGTRKGEPKDVTEVGRVVLYDMDRDIIVIQDKGGFYYEAPRGKNETPLRGLIHPDDYKYIKDYQSERKPTVEEPEPMITGEEFTTYFTGLKEKSATADEAKKEIEALFKEGRITRIDKNKAIRDLDSRKTKRSFRKKPKKEVAVEEETSSTGGLY